MHKGHFKSPVMSLSQYEPHATAIHIPKKHLWTIFRWPICYEKDQAETLVNWNHMKRLITQEAFLCQIHAAFSRLMQLSFKESANLKHCQ